MWANSKLREGRGGEVRTVRGRGQERPENGVVGIRIQTPQRVRAEKGLRREWAQ